MGGKKVVNDDIKDTKDENEEIIEIKKFKRKAFVESIEIFENVFKKNEGRDFNDDEKVAKNEGRSSEDSR